MTKQKLILRSLISPIVDTLEGFTPVNKSCFCIPIQFRVGLSDQVGEESFDLVVCSPQWLELNAMNIGIVNGRHHLIVNIFDFDQVKSYIEEYLGNIRSQSWNEMAQEISRLGYWEFEDYSEE